MKNVDRYMMLKAIGKRGTLKKQKSLERYGSNASATNIRPPLSRKICSNEDLVEDEEDLENQEFDPAEDAAMAAKLAEEAYAANLKMLKKQKAKFLRLQKILSRNVILIPLCAVFSVLSAFTIFASTLTDHYELISYDVDFLRHQVDIENNRSMSELNKRTGLNFTLADFLKAVRTRSFDPPPSTTTKSPPPSSQAPPHHNTLLDTLQQGGNGAVVTVNIDASAINNNSPYKNDLAERRREMILEHLQATYVYEMSSIITREYYVVQLINYPSLTASNELLNNTIKTNVLYATYSGIWKFCNYLSNESRQTLKIEKCTFYKTTNIEQDASTDPLVQHHYHTHRNHHAQNKHSTDSSSSSSSSSDSSSSDPGRDLVRMHNAAACCTIVSYFLLVVSWITGLTAAFTKRVPVSLASWVLNILIGVFLFLMLAIFHRKILIESKRNDCLDLKIVFNIVCSSRTVKFGYSLGLTWLAFIFTTINAICWLHITKMQKLLFAHGYYYN